jgi:adenylate cyclase
VFGGIELGWLDASQSFNLTDLPLKIGRVPEADFVINDPRVSRMHASIDIRSGNYVLEDTSSYGTWVRFAGNDNDDRAAAPGVPAAQRRRVHHGRSRSPTSVPPP